MRVSGYTVPAVLLCLALLAPEAAAQAPGTNLQLIPKIGVYLPVNDLGEAREAAEEITTELEASLALGLALELDLPLSPVNVRANLDYATGSEVSREGISEDEDGPDATVLALTGDLVFRPLPRIVLLQPYLLAGAGVKIYEFDTDDLSDTTLRTLFEDDETDFAIHLGGGLDVKVSRNIAVLVEVSDYISWYELTEDDDSEIQNDLFGMVGFRVGLF